MSVTRMTDLDLAGKRLLIRQDLNVPINASVHHCLPLNTVLTPEPV